MGSHERRFIRDLKRIKYWDIIERSDEIWRLQHKIMRSGEILRIETARIHWLSHTVIISQISGDTDFIDRSIRELEAAIRR